MAERTFEEWRDAARDRLAEQSDRAAEYQDYFDGAIDVVAQLNTDERATFRRFLRESKANWCELVVNAVAERLQVMGFRFGEEQASQHAWDLWQASQMDANASLVQRDALVCGSAFVLVQPDSDNPTGVEISGESPFDCTVLYEPGRRHRRAAAYKLFGDEVEVLLLPDVIVTWEGDDRRPDVVANPSAPQVPMIEIRPQPRSYGPPRSELESAMSFQDRINTTLFARMVATDYGAFRQIWATGVKIERRPAPGDGTAPAQYVRPFNVGADRLLANENPEGRFGAFAESTLAGYINAVAQDVEQLAAITQTPPHYLLGKEINLSADAIKAAETGLVSKVSQRALFIGEAWEEVMRLALRLAGDPAADEVDAEVIWRDFETRSESQRVDALVKMSTLGVPAEVLWQKWGATPQEIDRWKSMRSEAEALTEPYVQLLGQLATGGAPR